MKTHRPVFRVETLEDRSLPAMLGSPWPDAAALTLSFAPDGAKNGTAPSALFRTMNAIAPPAVWEKEILRAFQTWAVNSNINIGLTGDNAQPFGTPGDIQGDARFGDIRIGALPLSADSAANTSPFDWSIGTWSGDVILNSNLDYTVSPKRPSAGEDLFTIALHEAGHVLGLPDSDDPSSAMYDTYIGPRTGPSAADVAALQAVYGVRSADPDGGNNAFATATPLGRISAAASRSADIGSNADADTYSFGNGLGSNFAVEVKTSGISLLVPKVSVYNATGRLVGSAAATNPTNSDVRVSVKNAVPGATYFVRVTGATGDVFGVGRYQLTVSPSSSPPPAPSDVFVKDGGTNDTLGTATVLTTAQPGVAFQGNYYAYNGVIENTADVDTYQAATPSTPGLAMIVRVRAMVAGSPVPALTVFDATGRPMPTQLLASDGSTFTLQVLGTTPGANYFMQVANPSPAVKPTGNYRLTVNFQVPDGAVMHQVAAGQVGGQAVGGPAAGAVSSLTVGESRLYQFSFFSAPADGTTSAPLTVTITDATGRTVLSLTQAAGQPAATAAVYLVPGTYTITVAEKVTGNQTAPPTDYWLYASVESDPIGTYMTSVGTSPTSTTTTTTTTTSSSTTSYSGYYYYF